MPHVDHGFTWNVVAFPLDNNSSERGTSGALVVAATDNNSLHCGDVVRGVIHPGDRTNMEVDADMRVMCPGVWKVDRVDFRILPDYILKNNFDRVGVNIERDGQTMTVEVKLTGPSFSSRRLYPECDPCMHYVVVGGLVFMTLSKSHTTLYRLYGPRPWAEISSMPVLVHMAPRSPFRKAHLRVGGTDRILRRF